MLVGDERLERRSDRGIALSLEERQHETPLRDVAPGMRFSFFCPVRDREPRLTRGHGRAPSWCACLDIAATPGLLL
jgi:hypothetical protein